MRRRINIRNFHFGKEVVKEKRYVDYLSSMLINKSVIREFQIYHYESYLINKIENHQEKYRNLKINNSLKNARSEMILMILEKTTSFFQQVLLITSIISHSLTLGDYSYIGGVTAKLKSSVNQLLGLISEINITDIQYRHFTEIINRKPSIYTDGTMDPPNGKKVIEFKNVSFKYPNCNNYAIKNVSFTYDSNEKIALVGQNGSGKSTLIKLLLRFYDPTEGEILLNGINVKEYNVDKYRGIFASMFQDPLIYSLSIEENVALNKTEEINSERVSEILSLLNLNQEIDIKRQYGREFDPNGYVFSAGQRQRLYSARTLYHNRDIYILDEPAASMDALSEYEFFNALNKYTRDRGLIYITHRYGILNKMNKILVLEYGELIESGNHSELINQQGLYFKMYKLQEKEFNTVKKEHFYET